MTTQATMNAVRALPLARKAASWDEVERCPYCQPFTHVVASSRVPPGLLVFTAEALGVRSPLDDFNAVVPVPNVDGDRVMILIRVPGDPTTVRSVNPISVHPGEPPCLCAEGGEFYFRDPAWMASLRHAEVAAWEAAGEFAPHGVA